MKNELINQIVKAIKETRAGVNCRHPACRRCGGTSLKNVRCLGGGRTK
jgi:hypothetical protein